MVLQVAMAPRAQLVRLALPGSMVRLVQQEPRVLLGPPAMMVLTVQMGRPAQLAVPAPQGQQGRLEMMAQTELQGQQVQRELPARTVLMGL